MSGSADRSATSVDHCACCSGITAQTPATVVNRPGLSAVAYRVGTHPSFKASMLARLGKLAGLGTRDDGDFTIALLDAFAAMADVLTFYQERLVNESYLRTAVDRASLARLGELIGYRPRPGVAASAYVAFTMTAAPGAPEQAAAPVTIAQGTRIQSIPGPGERPQTFETMQDIAARVEWNALRPSLTKPQPVSGDADGFLFQGVAAGLRAGDAIIVVPTEDGSTPVLRTVSAVTPLSASQTTRVELLPLTSATPPPPPHPQRAISLPPRRRAREVDLLLRFPRDLLDIPVFEHADLLAYSLVAGFPVTRIFNGLRAFSPPDVPSVFALRARASLFGHSAPDPKIFTAGTTQFSGSDFDQHGDWAVQTVPPPNAQGQQVLYLDGVYRGIVPSGTSSTAWGAVTLGDQWIVGTMDAVTERGVARYGLSGKVTEVTLTPIGANTTPPALDISTFANLRSVAVLADSTPLALARLPRSDEPVGPGDQLDLDGWVDGLYAGQKLIVSGELDESRGTFASEVVEIERVDQIIDVDGNTRLTLASGLTNAYVRATVVINGNVALATHGETVQEVLGSGDASQSDLAFTLRQKPLTFTSDAVANGARSSLELRVHGLLWSEVTTLFGRTPSDRVYTTRDNDDGSTTVMFGDGLQGARPPTSAENVRALYRKGLGAAGNVGAHKLELLTIRPLGVSSVTNPLEATGGTEPESADDIRANAALTTRTLGRIVSLQDYEDFARAFSGIAKALATPSWQGQVRGVFLTVAGTGGATMPDDSPLLSNLAEAIADSAEPNVLTRVKAYRKAYFTLSATILVDPARVIDDVLADAENRLRSHFSFEARAFGQPVTLGEVVAFLQDVPGVVAAEVTALERSGVLRPLIARGLRGGGLVGLRLPVGILQPPEVQTRLSAALPEIAEDDLRLGAELLTLDPRPLKLVGEFA